MAAKDSSTEAASRRWAASRALPSGQYVSRREAAEPAGPGAGVRCPACAGYDAAAQAQHLVLFVGAQRVGGAVSVAIVVPDERLAVPEVEGGVRNRAGQGTKADRGEGHGPVQAGVAVHSHIEWGGAATAAGLGGVDDQVVSGAERPEVREGEGVLVGRRAAANATKVEAQGGAGAML